MEANSPRFCGTVFGENVLSGRRRIFKVSGNSTNVSRTYQPALAMIWKGAVY